MEQRHSVLSHCIRTRDPFLFLLVRRIQVSRGPPLRYLLRPGLNDGNNIVASFTKRDVGASPSVLETASWHACYGNRWGRNKWGRPFAIPEHGHRWHPSTRTMSPRVRCAWCTCARRMPHASSVCTCMQDACGVAPCVCSRVQPMHVFEGSTHQWVVTLLVE